MADAEIKLSGRSFQKCKYICIVSHDKLIIEEGSEDNEIHAYSYPVLVLY